MPASAVEVGDVVVARRSMEVVAPDGAPVLVPEGELFRVAELTRTRATVVSSGTGGLARREDLAEPTRAGLEFYYRSCARRMDKNCAAALKKSDRAGAIPPLERYSREVRLCLDACRARISDDHALADDLRRETTVRDGLAILPPIRPGHPLVCVRRAPSAVDVLYCGRVVILPAESVRPLRLADLRKDATAQPAPSTGATALEEDANLEGRLTRAAACRYAEALRKLGQPAEGARRDGLTALLAMPRQTVVDFYKEKGLWNAAAIQEADPLCIPLDDKGLGLHRYVISRPVEVRQGWRFTRDAVAVLVHEIAAEIGNPGADHQPVRSFGELWREGDCAQCDARGFPLLN